MPPVFSPLDALAQLFFPHNCCGCGTDLLPADGYFCLYCFSQLPFTSFEKIPGNAVEKLFTGRVNVEAGMALFYFTAGSAVRTSLHRFKYQGDQQVGKYLGGWMADRIKDAGRFDHCDAIVPLPLHRARERKRGFNQSAVLGAALATGLNLPLIRENLIRRRAAGSQTKKSRAGRWRQIQDSFTLRNAGQLAGKRLLLVDDVVTTGATLEAAARLLTQIPGVSVNIACLACSVEV